MTKSSDNRELTAVLKSKTEERLGSLEIPEAFDRWQGVNLEDDKCTIRLRSDGLNLELKSKIEKAVLEALRSEMEAHSLHLRIHFKRSEGAAPSFSPSPQAAAAAPVKGPFGSKIDRQAIPGVRTILAVTSGKGGVGKSTVSSNLAVQLASEGYKVGLLDCDLYGPSIPLMFGLQGRHAVSPKQMILPAVSREGVKIVSFGLLSDPDQPVIWRGPLISKALNQLFFQTDWEDLDVLILDLPPGTGDVQLTMIEKLPVLGGLVVTTPQNVALLDAVKGLKMLKKLDIPLLGIVENMSYFECPACHHQEAIFGDEAKKMSEAEKVPILARLPIIPEVRIGGDSGAPAVSKDQRVRKVFEKIAKKIAEDLHLTK